MSFWDGIGHGVVVSTALWTVLNSTSGECQCGNNLEGVVHCDSVSKQISLLVCYCMSYSKDFNTTVVGPCNVLCSKGPKGYGSYNVLKVDGDLNGAICADYDREGQLCGKCAAGFGPPVYSYSLKCVRCLETEFKLNIIKYVVVAFLPLTAFYLGAIMFKLSVTSGDMVVYVLMCQLVSVPSVPRFLLRHTNRGVSGHLPMALYAIWNLDFFRCLYSPFCIHPRLSTLHVLALDYLIVYPLLLIFLTGTRLPDWCVPSGTRLPDWCVPSGTRLPDWCVPSGTRLPDWCVPSGTRLPDWCVPSGTRLPDWCVPSGTRLPDWCVPSGTWCVPSPLDIPHVHCSNTTRSLPTSSDDMETSIQGNDVHQTRVGHTWFTNTSICYFLDFVVREDPLCLLFLMLVIWRISAVNISPLES